MKNIFSQKMFLRLPRERGAATVMGAWAGFPASLMTPKRKPIPEAAISLILTSIRDRIYHFFATEDVVVKLRVI
jgi:hypothetical protein